MVWGNKDIQKVSTDIFFMTNNFTHKKSSYMFIWVSCGFFDKPNVLMILREVDDIRFEVKNSLSKWGYTTADCIGVGARLT